MALLGDTCSGEILRRESIAFIVTHFDRISRTALFEEMARENLDLLFEILRLRQDIMMLLIMYIQKRENCDMRETTAICDMRRGNILFLPRTF